MRLCFKFKPMEKFHKSKPSTFGIQLLKTGVLLYLFLFTSFTTNAQTAINTSFESTDNYIPGSISNQNKWTLTSGSCEVTTTSEYVKTGTQALKISSSGSSVQTELISYSSGVAGLSGDVYIDFRINFRSFPTSSFAITGYDLGSTSHRSFMLEFQSSGKIKLYDGSSGWTTQPEYKIDTWIRITVKIDQAGTKCQYALDGVVIDKLFAFREIKNNATTFDYNSIRFAMNSGTSDLAVDDLYIGTTAVSGIAFQESSKERTVSITQPSNGTITLEPNKSVYELNDQVIATVSVPEHYLFTGWTGHLSGTENPKTITIDKNYSFGATVIVDPANPPASSTITINQPVGGTITLSPDLTTYYNGTSITATLNLQTGYQFDGWTGSFSGTTNPKTFVLSENTILGANTSEIPVSTTIRTVTTAAEFKTAVGAMNPGDTILVMDGTYNLSSVKISRSGTSLYPILIKSKNLYGAKITGESGFTLSQISHVTIEGFEIDIEPKSTIFKMEGCSYVRITRNWMKMQVNSDSQTSKWITIGDIWENPVCNSHHNRIDHNLFDGKYDSGAWLIIDGSHGDVPDISKYDRIDHNIFRNNTPRFDNEKETIRVGVSDLSLLSAHCTIENNLFEDCDGDPEIVSVKSCDNIVRNNTFRRCLGTLSLRHGFNTVVEGNFFFGEGKTAQFNGSTIGCGGVRIYGKGHTVINNYMEGLTGSKWDAACTITNGDVTNTSTSLSSHFLPENLVFAFNTLVNNTSNIEIGFTNNGSYGKAPINCVLANNIVTASENELILSYSASSLNGVSFSNNIMNPTGTASLGLSGITDSQIRIIDPLLVDSDCRAFGANCSKKTPESLYKLSALSPAINASIGYTSVVNDFEGQAAVGIRDIGADEYNADSEITNGPLSELQVGPTAPENYVYEIIATNAVTRFEETQIRAYPNPFTGSTRISVPISKAGKLVISLYNSLGQLIQQTTEQVSAGNFNYTISTSAKGFLYCKVDRPGESVTIKLVSR